MSQTLKSVRLSAAQDMEYAFFARYLHWPQQITFPVVSQREQPDPVKSQHHGVGRRHEQIDHGFILDLERPIPC